MVNELHSDQIDDSSIVEESELASKGVLGTAFSGALSVSQITSGTKTIEISSGDFNEPRAQKGDILIITGGASAGTYSVDAVISDTELTVNESIVSGTTGTINIFYRSGSSLVGYDSSSSGVFDSSVDTVKKALDAIENILPSATLESFFNGNQDSTTSDGWVLSFSDETTPKEAGQYIVLHTAQCAQSQNNKTYGYRVQWRENATGGWSDLLKLNASPSKKNQFDPKTGFNLITIGSNSTIEVRFQFGQTDDGGTAKIKNKGFITWKVL